MQQKDGSFDVFPFTKTMTNAILFVFELPPGKERIDTYQVPPQYRLRMEKPVVLSEVSTRLAIEKGKHYVVIPAVKREQEEGEFVLSLYFNLPLHQIDIRNLTDPTNRCK